MIAENCAKALTEIAEFENGRCVFLSSGSEAVEYGIQLAKTIRPDRKCLCLREQYLSAYGSGKLENSADWEFINWDYNESKSIEQYYHEISMAVDFSKIGVFVFEPGNSSGLVKLPSYNLVEAVARICKENEIIVVVDEVTTGIGRTGKWFGYMHYSLKPDIIAAGKGLGNGYPVSVVIMEQKSADLAIKKHFHYAQSHQNDPMGCAVAYAVINKIKKEHILEQSQRTSQYFIQRYTELQKEIPIIKEIRGRGMLICIQLSDTVSSNQMNDIERVLYEKGVITGVKPNERVIRTYCPLVITRKMIDEYINILRDILIQLIV